MTDPQVIVNLGTGGADLNGRSGSSSGADSNDPKFLDWDGENYVYLPGVFGNDLSVPDEAALDITGDIDIRVRVALDDWTPAGSNQTFLSKSATGQRSYAFSILLSGYLRLTWTTDGNTINTADGNAAPTVSDGNAKWVRVTMDVNNGAGNYEVKFWQSDDGSTWSQVGSTITGASTTSIHAGTAPLYVGYEGHLGWTLTGRVYRAIVKDGIDGTTVLDVDTSLVASGSDTSFTARTGQTVTINRSSSGRKSVAVTHPVWLFGTDDYMEVADNDLLDFGASDSFTVLAVVRQWATPTSSGAYISKYSSTPLWRLSSYGTGLYGRFLVNDGTDQVDNIAGPTTFTAGSFQTITAVIDRDAATGVIYQNGTAGTSRSIAAIDSLASTWNVRIGSNTGFGYQDFEFYAAAIFRRALSASEIAAITTYFQNRVA